MPRDNADDDTGPIRRVPPAGGDRRVPPRRPRRPANGDPARADGPHRRPTRASGDRPAEKAPRTTPEAARDTPVRRGERTATGDAPAERPGRAAARSRSDGRRRRANSPAGVTAGGAAAEGLPVRHGHGHAHGPAAPASPRVRKLLTALLVPFALAAVVGVAVLYPWGQSDPASMINSGTPVNGDVVAVSSGACLAPGQVSVGGNEPQPGDQQCLIVETTLTDGDAAGHTIIKSIPQEPSTPRFAVGDAVVLAHSGADAADPESYQLVDFQRGVPLGVLAALFAVAVLILGRWQGLAALGALVLSFAVLLAFVLPAILAGENPLLVAVAGAGLIMFAALYLTHGISARTSVAVLGTLISLALIGVISTIFSASASLTGLDDDTTNLIGALGHSIDARGLLLAGVVIGALGVLDDVTVTQTSAVWELRRANPSLSWRELYGAGLRIGRDHVASAVNTLVMAYAGAALPVMLYSSISGVGFGAILGSQDIASEIVRTLAGSIGIVAAVPITTVLAALIASREPIPTSTTDNA